MFRDKKVDFSQTYDELEATYPWDHLGVGRRDRIPQVVPSLAANVLYGIFLFAIAFGFTEIAIDYAPYAIGGSVASIAAFAFWVKGKYEDIVVHRLGIWWNPDKVITGDFLCNENDTENIKHTDLQKDAKRYLEEGHIALTRARTMTGTPPTYGNLVSTRAASQNRIQREMEAAR